MLIMMMIVEAIINSEMIILMTMSSSRMLVSQPHSLIIKKKFSNIHSRNPVSCSFTARQENELI